MAIIGAIRFDPWYSWSPSTVPGFEQKMFDVAGMQFRAPWFAQVISPYQVKCVGAQSYVDLECQVAATAGIDYWAFGNYQPNPPGSVQDPQYAALMSIAWNYYQASPNNGLVKWCWRTSINHWTSASGNFADNTWQPFLADMAARHCTQSNYQRVLSNRPLVYAWNIDATVNTANMATAITYFRGQCTANGLGSPYMVMQTDASETSAVALARATACGFDAVSNYSVASYVTKLNCQESYDTLDTGAKAKWASQVAAGGKLIPCGITGWDLRAVVRAPMPNSHSFPRISDNSYFVPPSEARVATHVADLMAFVAANPTNCEAGALLYSWTECSEGGRPLIPTLGDPPVGGTTRLLTAIKGVLRP